MKKTLLLIFSIFLSYTVCDLSLGYLLFRSNYAKPDLVNDATGDNYNFTSDFKKTLSLSYDYSKHINILFLGDSFVRAIPLNDDDRIPAQLQKLLQHHNPSIKVHNAGSSGANTLDNYFILKRFLNKVTPDLIIYFHNDNDYLFTEFNLDKYKFCNQLRGAQKPFIYYLARISNIAYYMYHRLVFENNTEHTLNNTQYKCSFDYLEKVKEISYDLPVVFLNHMSSFKQMKYCDSNSISYDRSFLKDNLDIESLFVNDGLFSKGCHNFYRYYSKDNYHYNRLGNQVIAKSIYDYILQSKLYSDTLNIKVALFQKNKSLK